MQQFVEALRLEEAGAESMESTLSEPTFDVVISAVESPTPHIKVLSLRSAVGEKLPAWTPGAHIDLLLPNGMVRQYSLCGPVSDRDTWRIGVLRDPSSRGGSEFVHNSLDVGDVVVIRGPRNNFPLSQSDNYIFVAGGIGVTPLIAMAREAESRGATWEFIYCGRNREAMAFVDELEADFGSRVRIHTDAEMGFFDFTREFAEARASTAIYACGPAPFLNVITAAAEKWPSGSVQFERFAPIVIEGAVDTEFEVELARTSQTLTVPADKSVLQVLRDGGIPILSSCGEGTCGTCEVAVLAGEIDHRDSVLSDDEQASGEMMMVCVSRCRSRLLVLDL